MANPIVAAIAPKKVSFVRVVALKASLFAMAPMLEQSLPQKRLPLSKAGMPICASVSIRLIALIVTVLTRSLVKIK